MNSVNMLRSPSRLACDVSMWGLIGENRWSASLQPLRREMARVGGAGINRR